MIDVHRAVMLDIGIPCISGCCESKGQREGTDGRAGGRDNDDSSCWTWSLRGLSDNTAIDSSLAFPLPVRDSELA